MSKKKKKRKLKQHKKKQSPKRTVRSGRPPVDMVSAFQKGVQFHQAGHLEQAAAVYREILNMDPGHSDALHLLGNVCYQLGRITESIDLMHQSIQMDRDNPVYHNNLGNVLKEAGRMVEAITCYKRAIQLSPGLPGAHYNMGEALQSNGQFDDARLCYQNALKIKPDFAQAFHSLALTKKNTERDWAYLNPLADRLTDDQMTEEDCIFKYFALGKIHNDLGGFDRAFSYYQEGNRLERNRTPFTVASHTEYINNIIETFSRDFVVERQPWGMDTTMPVFVFGMPRSGTTLVDRIITSHSDVSGAGESPFFSQLGQNLGNRGAPSTYPEYFTQINSDEALSISERYIRHLKSSVVSQESSVHITDKMPQNFLFLGLLFILFPNARFVHCRRHPLDNCLSVYFHKFRWGHNYAYDLTDIGLYYRQYEKLMDHWGEILPSIFEVEYEDLVRSQEDISRKLLAYCGLEWNPKYLDFHKNEKSVATTMWDVRQPVYTSSVHRWKKYSQFLAPLKKIFPELV